MTELENRDNIFRECGGKEGWEAKVESYTSIGFKRKAIGLILFIMVVLSHSSSLQNTNCVGIPFDQRYVS